MRLIFIQLLLDRSRDWDETHQIMHKMTNSEPDYEPELDALVCCHVANQYNDYFIA